MNTDPTFTESQRQELKTIVADVMKDVVPQAMDEYFKDKGLTVKHLLITAATVVGSITVIITGMKGILAYFGIQYISIK